MEAVARSREISGALPTRLTRESVALYRFSDSAGDLLYIGVCDEPVKRWYAHADAAWWPDVERFHVRWYPSRREAEDAEAQAIRREKPRYNVVFNGVPYKGARFPGARLYDLTREHFGSRSFTLNDLVDELGVPYGSAISHAQRLEREGLFERVGRRQAPSGRMRTHFRVVARD
ncbi:GIY-YIG nuclease family protein [Streptomyces griseoincarnatus]